MGFRIIWPVTNGESLTEAFSDHWNKIFMPLPLFKMFFLAFIPVSFIPVISYKNFYNFCRKNLYLSVLLPLTLISALFGQDNERLMLPFIPVYYLFIAELFNNLKEENRIRNHYFLIFIFLAFFSSLYHLWGIFILPDRIWSLFSAVLGSLITAALFYKLFKKEKS